MKEDRMNPIEMSEEELDRALSSHEQVGIRELVRSLAEDAPSMVWRSKLNERLQTEAHRRLVRRRAQWIWRPALGLGLAGCLAITLYIRTTQPEAQPKAAPASIEAALVSAHVDSVAANDVAAEGLSPVEAADDSADGASQSDSAAGTGS